MVIYYLFLILAIFFGYILHFNRYFSWYRNLIHFFAGIFSSIIGIYFIVRLDNIGYLKFSVLFTYSLFFSGFVTSLWTIASALLVDFFGYSSSGTVIRVGMGLIGAACFSVLLILDYLIYHSRYLEKLIQKL
ncbi:MAG: hypothetical protein PHX62_09330 [Bacilli bacterium]|nr:hypothetical protein [Bacilli bacterium]